MESVLEGIMMISFGASWPMAIIKTIKVKNPTGKSFIFMYLIEIGYLCGLAAKLIFHPHDPVILLYITNILMVGTDLTLSLYYKHRMEKARSSVPA